MKTEPGKDKMFTLVGKGVSPGLAKGKAFVYICGVSSWQPSLGMRKAYRHSGLGSKMGQ